MTKTALTKTTPTTQQNQELKNDYDVKNLLNVQMLLLHLESSQVNSQRA